MAKSLRRPPVQGTPDPDLPGHVLVPVRKQTRGLPKVNYSVPDTSYFRVSKRTNRPTAVVTVTPDGLPVAWDSCGACSASVRLCQCASGITAPNSITHIYVTRGGVKPEPLPLAVPFQPPVPLPPINKPPRKQLKRRKDEAVAEALVTRELKKLKRRR